jgi:hypothetical protein
VVASPKLYVCPLKGLCSTVFLAPSLRLTTDAGMPVLVSKACSKRSASSTLLCLYSSSPDKAYADKKPPRILYVCMYVCMCIYMCVYICTHAQTMRFYACVLRQVQKIRRMPTGSLPGFWMYVCMCVCIYIYRYTCTHARILYVCMYVYVILHVMREMQTCNTRIYLSCLSICVHKKLQ